MGSESVGAARLGCWGVQGRAYEDGYPAWLGRAGNCLWVSGLVQIPPADEKLPMIFGACQADHSHQG